MKFLASGRNSSGISTSWRVAPRVSSSQTTAFILIRSMTPESALRLPEGSEREGPGSQPFLHHLHRPEKIGPYPVHLVDEGDSRHPIFIGLMPDRLRLGLYPPHCVKKGHCAIQHPQASLHFDGEIHMAGGIDQVNLIPLPWSVVTAEVMVMPRSCSWCIQSMTASPSWTSPILWDRPEVVEDPLGNRGLAGVDVRHDPDCCEFYSAGLCLWVQPLVSLTLRFTAEHAENAEKDPAKYIIIKTLLALALMNLLAGCRKSPFRPQVVIPRKQESRVPGENRDPVFEMVPDFRRDDAWTPAPARTRSGVRRGDGDSELFRILLFLRALCALCGEIFFPHSPGKFGQKGHGLLRVFHGHQTHSATGGEKAPLPQGFLGDSFRGQSPESASSFSIRPSTVSRPVNSEVGTIPRPELRRGKEILARLPGRGKNAPRSPRHRN